MDAELKAKWVAALRSGEYEQGRGGLRNSNNSGGDTFCCLGVLCDVINHQNWVNKVVYEHQSDRSAGYLPISLRIEIGLSEEQESQLAGKNDDGESFGRIADYIEAHL